MKRWKLALYSILICLPAVLIVVGGAVFVCREIPGRIRYEPRRVTLEYRDQAEQFKCHPETLSEVRTNRVGSKTGDIDGMPWGRFTENGRVFIWYKFIEADGKPEWRLKETAPITEFPYAVVFYAGGCVLAIILLWLSFLATACFLRFMRERDDFLAATAHDLTTPLVGMRMMIGKCDDEARRLNERMLLIVSNIKDFLRSGGKRKKPELKPVDIVALCKEAYQLFAADYEDSEGGEVEFCQGNDGEDAVATHVLADETMTLQILWNLFGNDLKYAAPYGKVAVRFVQEGGFVKIEFADEGQGMTPRQMKKAFDRYYRAKTVLESGKGGFGIGLCTAREFARAMGGDLTVRANVPKGCVFTLTLPRCGGETPPPPGRNARA